MSKSERSKIMDDVEYSLKYNDMWYITRILVACIGIYPPYTGAWANKNFVERIFTSFEPVHVAFKSDLSTECDLKIKTNIHK